MVLNFEAHHHYMPNFHSEIIAGIPDTFALLLVVTLGGRPWNGFEQEGIESKTRLFHSGAVQ